MVSKLVWFENQMVLDVNFHRCHYNEYKGQSLQRLLCHRDRVCQSGLDCTILWRHTVNLNMCRKKTYAKIYTKKICVVMTQNESEDGKDLLVSEDLFHLNICKFNLKNQALVASISLTLQRSNDLMNLLCKPWYCWFTSVWLQNSIDVCLKYKINLKPGTCRYRLPTHSAWVQHIILFLAIASIPLMI